MPLVRTFSFLVSVALFHLDYASVSATSSLRARIRFDCAFVFAVLFHFCYAFASATSSFRLCLRSVRAGDASPLTEAKFDATTKPQLTK